MKKLVSDIFDLLDRRRHLPGYRLEERLSPFFEFFLIDTLSAHFPMVDFHPIVIPEFPVREHTVYSYHKSTKSELFCLDSSDNNLHYNVDFVAFSKDVRQVFLIELKTDMGMRNVKQDGYLRGARKTPFHLFLEDIPALAKASRKKPKYVHLLHLLEQLNLVQIPSDGLLFSKTFSEPTPGWTNAFEGVKFCFDVQFAESKLVYIQPESYECENSNIHYISFCNVAKSIHRLSDLGKLFSKYLGRWSKKPGSEVPRQ